MNISQRINQVKQFLLIKFISFIEVEAFKIDDDSKNLLLSTFLKSLEYFNVFI